MFNLDSFLISMDANRNRLRKVKRMESWMLLTFIDPCLAIDWLMVILPFSDETCAEASSGVPLVPGTLRVLQGELIQNQFGMQNAVHSRKNISYVFVGARLQFHPRESWSMHENTVFSHTKCLSRNIQSWIFYWFFSLESNFPIEFLWITL